MEKLRAIWKSLSFTNKLKLSYIVVFMIPLVLLGGYSYSSSLSFLHKQMKQETNNAVERVTKDIESKLNQSEASLSLAVNNYSFQEFLSPPEGLSSLETARIADSYIGPFLYNVLLSNYYIDKLEVYSTQHFFVLTDLLKPSSSVEETDWYRQVSSSNAFFWWSEDEKLYVGKSIRNSITGKFLGIARVRIKQDLFSQSFNSFVTFPANITISQNENRKVIYEYNPENNNEYGYTITKTLAPVNWSITYDFPRQTISSFSNLQLLLNLTVILACLVLVGLMIHYLSRSIVKRIFILTHQMQEVREGNLNIDIDTSYQDEIGSLASSFQSMTTQINHLIKERYQYEIKQKELELRLLQEKINPHFLYNILSTINWIALENHQHKISQMINNLATFYRTALNQGKDISSLKTELDNIKSYIALQQIAREHSFEVNYEICPELLHKQVPNFIFQPLVENAIEYGVDTLRDMKGRITIRSRMTGTNYQIIIEDNGKELYKKYGESLFDERLYGYGLRNVNERIQLKTSPEHGVQIYIDSQGTHTIVTLPL